MTILLFFFSWIARFSYLKIFTNDNFYTSAARECIFAVKFLSIFGQFYEIAVVDRFIRGSEHEFLFFLIFYYYFVCFL